MPPHSKRKVKVKKYTQPGEDPSVPLRPARWEHFACLYSGECFGNGSKAYALSHDKQPDDPCIRVMAASMLRHAAVWDRIQWLRNDMVKQLAIDKTRILEMRLKIAYDKNDASAARLAALKDIEKSLGLAVADKVEMDLTGSVLVIE